MCSPTAENLRLRPRAHQMKMSPESDRHLEANKSAVQGESDSGNLLSKQAEYKNQAKNQESLTALNKCQKGSKLY